MCKCHLHCYVQKCTKWNALRFEVTQSAPISLNIYKKPIATSRGIILLRKMIVFKLNDSVVNNNNYYYNNVTLLAEKLVVFSIFFFLLETRKPCLSICFWSLHNWKSLGKAWTMASKSWIPAFWYEMLPVLELSLPFSIVLLEI